MYKRQILYGPPGLKDENLKLLSVVVDFTDPVGSCVTVTVTPETLTSPVMVEVVSEYVKETKNKVSSESEILFMKNPLKIVLPNYILKY